LVEFGCGEFPSLPLIVAFGLNALTAAGSGFLRLRR
jgi:hypothetical protein